MNAAEQLPLLPKPEPYSFHELSGAERPSPGLVLPLWARAWELRPEARVGQRVVASVQCGPLSPLTPLPVVRVWWKDGLADHAAPSIYHPWARMDSKAPSQPGARWLATECKLYARRHPEGWTLEGMRAHVLAVLESERSPVQITPKEEQ